MRVGGVILCGGRSSRMGRPKAWLPFGHEIMLPRVVRLLSEAVDPIVVVAASGQELPSLPHSVVIVRDEKERRGPLEGLAAGLRALHGQVDAVYLSSCDAPLLRPDFVRRLARLIGDAAACVPHVGGRCHPLAAIYRMKVAEAAARLLAEDKLRMFDLLDTVTTRKVEAAELANVDPTFETLRNLNTPEEYEAALREESNSGR